MTKPGISGIAPLFIVNDVPTGIVSKARYAMRPARSRPCVVVAIAVLLLGDRVSADEAAHLAPGSRVRVSASSLAKTVRGTLASLDDATLTLQTEGGAQPVMIERSRITRLEVSAGRRSHGHKAAYGAVIGLAVGLAFTAVVAANEDCSGYGAEDCGLAPAVSLIVLTPLLTGAGAGIGAALAPSERWVEVPPRARPAGGSARVGLRLAVRF